MTPTEARAVATQQIVWWRRNGVSLDDAARGIGHMRPQYWSDLERIVALEAMTASRILADRSIIVSGERVAA